MVRSEKTNVLDSTGKFYKTGDIVLNPFFGDVWVVHKYSKQDMEDYKFECKYNLQQYNNPENYEMELDEPAEFRIIKRKGQKGYYKLLNRITRYGKQLIKL